MSPNQTCFAPAERASNEEVRDQHRRLLQDRTLCALLDAFPEPALVLNDQRQIVLANDKLATLLDRRPQALLGMRPGEALSCVHADDPDGSGCGTTRFCRYCGAAHAIVETIGTRRPDVEACRIERTTPHGVEPLDLEVRTTPLDVGGSTYTVFAVRDTSHELRRRVLERMFFHDVLDQAGGLAGLLDVWPDLDGEEALDVVRSARDVALQLADGIESQRDLAAAERGDLVIRRGPVPVDALLETVAATYRRHAVAEKRSIVVVGGRGEVVETDGRLLGRALGNLVKNALEAVPPGGVVTLSYDAVERRFEVHNAGVMPEEAQLLMFQRSFTTKPGVGRGVGTYSVRLLVEKYLGGRVRFRSEPLLGTTFFVTV